MSEKELLEGNLKLLISLSFAKIKRQLRERKVSPSLIIENNNLELRRRKVASSPFKSDNRSASKESTTSNSLPIGKDAAFFAWDRQLSTGSSSEKFQSNTQRLVYSTCLLSSKIIRNSVILLILLLISNLMVNVNYCYCQDEKNARPIRRAKLLEATKHQSLLVQTRGALFKGVHLPVNNGKSSDTTQQELEASVIGFLGIRYASAPVKRLRFMPPSAYHYAPNQVYNMQRFGPICRQKWPIDVNFMPEAASFKDYSSSELESSDSSSLFVKSSVSSNLESNLEMQLRLMEGMMSREPFTQLRPLFVKLSDREQSEDCLNLNIYMPSQAVPGKSELAVLVIIHGESFDYGAGSSIDPSSFIHENNKLIVITFNFRLNILGFPPKLAGASRGNLGLLDQVAALHWIKDNINSFGGSPNNITLMGSKKGAIFVNLLALSPMAKGLFHRAIMEDGSALTPLVANQLAASGSQHLSSLTTTTNSRSIQHVRFLAKLCDCPTTGSEQQQQPLASSASADNNNASSSSVAPSTGPSSQQLLAASTSMSLSDETHKMNALTFECLRHKPIEQIMLPIPLHLIRFNQTTGQLQFELQGSAHLAGSSHSQNSSRFFYAQLVANPKTLGKLFLQAHSEKLKGKAYADTPASDLFDAIYTSPAQTLRPLFGPTSDGAIVPSGEDLAELMLKRGSPFTQRDLLLGLSQPLINQLSYNPDQPLQEIHPNHLLAELVSPALQREGLTNEQALDLVNTFVHSFYRYHNQEIINSIVNNFLTNPQRPVRKFHLRRFKTARMNNDSLDSLVPQNSKLTQQLLILDSLLDAFHDALTVVPVLKTGLIHANRQLDLLVDSFVGQQFEILKTQHHQQNNTTSIFESFVSFAQILFNHPNWPLELHSHSNQILPQAKSTYLYQFNLNHILREIYQVTLTISDTASLPERLIKETLLDLADSLQNTDLKYKINFNCIWNEIDEDVTVTTNEIFNKFICSRLGTILTQFVTSGRITGKQSEDLKLISSSTSDVSPLEHLESSCLNFSDSINTYPSSKIVTDHDPSALKTFNYQDILFRLSETCKQELSKLSIIYLLENTGSSNHESTKTWKTFNPFSQQIATLPVISQPPLNELWKMSHIVNEDDDVLNDSSKLDLRYSLMARSSFWSNFIPALNCSKTQPIIPSSPISSLTSLLGSSNSSLLTLNLLFSCQQGGTTSFEVIESLVESARSQLNLMIERWRLANRSHIMLPAAQQNHHSLRMANMSTKIDSLSGNQQIDAQQDSSVTNSEADPITNTDPNLDLHTKSTSLSLVISSTLLVALGALIISSGCFLIKSRKKQVSSRNQSNKRKLSAQVVSSSSTNDQTQQIPSQRIISVCNSSDQNHGSFSEGAMAGGFASEISQLTSTLPNDNAASQPETRADKIQVQPHFCTLVGSDDNNYIYWPQEADKQQLFDTTPQSMGICHSHSSMNVTNSVLATLQSADGNVSSTTEPIMVPLQGSSNVTTSNNSATLGRVKNSCLTNGFYTLDSSSESTQLQSVIIPPKKRVKIQDPLSHSKQTNMRKKLGYQDTKVYDLNDLSTTRNYCPMHRSQSNSSTLEPQYLVESSFQQPTLENQLEFWDGEFNATQQQHQHHHHAPSVLNNSNYQLLDSDPQSSFLTTPQNHHCVHTSTTSSYLPQTRALTHNMNSIDRDVRYHNHHA